jgi:hypothetical protein
MTQEALKLALECAERCEAIDGMYSWSATITAIKEALAEHAMQQRIGRELLQEPLELCQYGQEPASCTSNPMDCQCAIDASLAQTQEPVAPPWWNAVENILNEYGLQAIDFVADFKQALAQTQEPWCMKMNGCKTKCEDCPDEPPQRTWVGLMRGVRVDGDTVVITVKGGNDAARELCGELLKEKNT